LPATLYEAHFAVLYFVWLFSEM
jgi:hypothetical protein